MQTALMPKRIQQVKKQKKIKKEEEPEPIDHSDDEILKVEHSVGVGLKRSRKSRD